LPDVWKTIMNGEQKPNWAERIVTNQLEFQKLAEIPILSEDLAVKLHLTEGFILKAIEELIELRKTMPSAFNKYAKVQPTVNMERTRDELIDVILFIVNIALVWGFTLEELVSGISYIQANNFAKIRDKIRIRAQEAEAASQKGGKLF
jgi:hypothetical protein